MGQAQSDFETLLYDKLLPEFCSEPSRHLQVSSFRQESMRVSEADARYFLLAWRAGLIEHEGRGIYRAAMSSTGEQFFWEGPKAAKPRPFTLWLEPVITVAALARLHFDFGWPKDLIGCQSPDWAFDLVASLPDQFSEHIAGEVKRSSKEVDDLIAYMVGYGANPSATEPLESGKQRNAFKKVVALRKRRAPIFWAVGPDGDSRAFRVRYRDDDEVVLDQVDVGELRYPLA